VSWTSGAEPNLDLRRPREHIGRTDLNLIKPDAASAIARDHLAKLRAPELRVVDGKDAHVNVYGLRVPLGDCWVVMLRSSEIILVAKESGEVVYHGSANDEG
jgi:hypothetical protein